VADSWTAESRITAAITAMAKEAQHAARKLRIVSPNRRSSPLWSSNPAARSSSAKVGALDEAQVQAKRWLTPITVIIVSYFLVFNVRESVTFRVETPVFSVTAIDEEVRGPIHAVPSGLSGGATHSLNVYGQLLKLSETRRPHRSVVAP
jgi:hypothetical protein